MTTPLSFHQFHADLHSSACRDEARTSWAIFVLYRRPALPLAWGAARLGLRPMAITGAALVLALSLPIQALFWPLGWAVWAVVLGGALYQILDCTDGTLARVTGQSSQAGADMDFLVDMTQWAMLYTAIGILADRTLDTGGVWTALALGAAWLRLMARVIRDRVAPPEPPQPEFSAETAPDRIARFIGGLSGLLPFLGLFGSGLGVAVWILVAYALMDLADTLWSRLHR